MNENRYCAVVDLGSNSFHLVAAEKRNHSIQYHTHLKEVVRIADGIDANGLITIEKQAEALSVLQAFGNTLEQLCPCDIRAVATSAFRKARNAGEFLLLAEKELGVPVEVIPGREEARLIYQGVCLGLHESDQTHLVVDIGGGSTEIILGRGEQPFLLQSIEVGNISLTRKLFHGKVLDRNLFETAVDELFHLLQHTMRSDHPVSWDMAIGASGTLRLIATLLRQFGFSDQGITRWGVESLIEMVFSEQDSRAMLLAAVPEERRATFPAALALIRAIFDFFSISLMHVSEYGVRDGVLAELAGIRHLYDRREESVYEMMDYYGVDKQRAIALESFTRHYYGMINQQQSLQQEQTVQLLSYASLLHEIGRMINDRGFHKHGAYLVYHAKMAGFTRQEQGQLAYLLINQRKRIKTTHPLAQIPAEWGLVLILRLGKLLMRSGFDIASLDTIRSLSWDGRRFTCELQKGVRWQYPLLMRNLERERDYWAEMDIEYDILPHD